MKDQASCSHGRSSRRDDDDDRHIRQQEGRRIKDDGYRDADGYRTRQSAKGDHIAGAKQPKISCAASTNSLLSSTTKFSHQTSSRVSRDGTLVSLRGLLGRAP